MNVASVRKFEWAIFNLVKAEFEYCFWNILEDGFIWIIYVCMSILPPHPYICYIYLKYKETNELLGCPLYSLVGMNAQPWCKKSLFWNHKSPQIPEISFWNWKWELCDCPSCFPNKQNKISLKK